MIRQVRGRCLRPPGSQTPFDTAERRLVISANSMVHSGGVAVRAATEALRVWVVSLSAVGLGAMS